MDELLWSLAFALLASGLSFALLGRSRRTREHLQGRLGEDAEGRGTWAALVPLTDGLAGMIPGRASAREDLARELREAGYYRQTALREYLGIRAALVAIPLLIALVAGVFVPDRQIVPALGAGFGTALLAFGLPRAFVRAKGVRRRREIERALPVSVDLITLGLAAGQGLPAASARRGRARPRRDTTRSWG
jgi:pilus assembly protein TadC